MHKSEAFGFDWYRGESPELSRALKVAAKLSAKGLVRQYSRYSFTADHKPYCDDPIRVRFGKKGKDAGPPVEVAMWAPCRKCPKCLQFRQMKWRQRVYNELMLTEMNGRRSWWVTLTFSPVHLAGILAEASPAGGSAKAVERAAYKHVQKYLDRLRKASKTRFRYLAVFERGEKTGRGHYHLVLHEVGPKPILKANIEKLWRSHVHARLVHIDKRVTGLASYISKYATKDVTVRPRASTGYGRSPGPQRGGT